MRIRGILSTLALGLLMVGVVVAADKAPTVKDELKRLTGAWKMFDMELNGNGTPRAEVKSIVIDGDKYTFYHEMNKSPEATIVVNPAADPRTIDVTSGGKTKLGIYRFQGGRLEICLAQDGKPRPSVFASAGEPGAGSILYVLKPKNPPAELDPEEKVYQDEMKKLTGKWTATSREIGGRPDSDPKNHGVLIEDGRYTTLFKGNSKDTMNILRVDPKADPPTIDFRTGNGKMWYGIYRLTDNKLEICLPNISPGKRPTLFTTKKEVGAGVSHSIYSKE